MLEDLDVDGVRGAFGVLAPDLGHGETHPVERHVRAVEAVVGKLLRVAEGAADALDPARLAAAVPGRSDMARRDARQDADGCARGEARVGAGITADCSMRFLIQFCFVSRRP